MAKGLWMEQMNEHGAAAMAYWSTELPVRYSRIEDPLEFFRALGEQVEAEIEELYLQYQGEDPAQESAEEKEARLEQAMRRAKEEVYALLVTPDPASQGEPYADLDQATSE
ncbi:MAG TPA: hypothetical protein VFA06_06290 [Actinocrinis sp.]|jgi:hypothetical protein|uniref:hypothetical protein n=1 Tax=Actinocrinis sp. TaxID=1920516 RepID=UPI002D37F0B4|nr:hypothetical protein [Actinocrinis sp.]HZU55459.1 hypothetical protein [Actinocrinis sp.]